MTEGGIDMQPPAGWYPDPNRVDQERLWTGTSWTSWIRPSGPRHSVEDPAGWRPDPNSAGSERLWTGDAWTDERREALAEPDEGKPHSDGGPGSEQRTLYVDRRPPKQLANPGFAASFCLVLTIVANVAVVITNQRYVGLTTQWIDGEDPSLSQILAAEDDSVWANRAYLGALALAMITFIYWFASAYRNLPRRGISNLRFGPGWAIGGWFVPILSFFRPKAIANDIWKGSVARPTESDSWRGQQVPSRLNWWWGLWIAGNIVGLIGLSVQRSANADLDDALGSRDVNAALDTERTGIYLDSLAGLLLIAAAVVAILVIREISNLQDAPVSADVVRERAGHNEATGLDRHIEGRVEEADSANQPPSQSGTSKASDAAALKTCPECAEDVKFAARKCRYCGYRFAEGR